MGRPAGWMTELTGRSPMRSPGAPSHRREVEREFWREIAKGLLPEEAAHVVGASQAVGGRWFHHGGGMSPFDLKAFSGRYLSFREREEIAVLRAQGTGVREIARTLGRSAFSARCRLSSPTSSFDPRVPSAASRARFTQLPSVPSFTPRSRATAAIGLPVSSTIRTPPSRNSRSYFFRFSGFAILVVDASTVRGEPHSSNCSRQNLNDEDRAPNSRRRSVSRELPPRPPAPKRSTASGYL